MEIPLRTGGKSAIVSPEDYKHLSKFPWYLTNSNDEQKFYVRTRIQDKEILMHRYIMKAKRDQIVDHDNSNGLDNRRENLKFSTSRQNSENKLKQKGKYSSDYYNIKVVNGKYVVSFKNNGIYITFQQNFSTEIEAAEAYDMYLVHNNITYRKYNFPDKLEEYKSRPFDITCVSKRIAYIGVDLTNNINEFMTTVQCGDKSLIIHQDSDVIKCARAYDNYIVKNGISNMKLNFPHEHLSYKSANKIKTLYKNVNRNVIKLISADIIKQTTKQKDPDILIDKKDYDMVKYYECYVDKHGYVNLSIKTNIVLLHRFLKGIKDPYIYVDHINHNKLDSRRKNLRVSNAELNAQNTSKRKGSASLYVGITKTKSNTWQARIVYQGKRTTIGTEKTEERAARRRDLYIMDKLPDTHYSLAFKWTEKEIEYWKHIFDKKFVNEENLNEENLNEDNLNEENLNEENLNEDNLDEDNLDEDNLNEENLNEENLNEDNLDEDNLDEDKLNEDNLDEDNLDEDNLDEDNLDEDNLDKNTIFGPESNISIELQYKNVCKNGNLWVIDIRHNNIRFRGTESTKERAGRRRDLYIIEHSLVSKQGLIFQWTNEDMEYWKIIFDKRILELASKHKKSKYIGVSLHGSKWSVKIRKKRIYNESDEKIAAIKRELYIINHTDIQKSHELNFNWTDEEIIYWKNYISTLNN